MIRHRPQRVPCPFYEIVAERAAAHVIVETEGAIAILDIAPVRRGHTLLLPRRHVEDLTKFGAADAIAAIAWPLQTAAGLLVDRLGATGLTCIQANGATAGQEIAHLHVHLVPRFAGDGRLTTWTRDLSEKDRVAEVHHWLTGDGIGESDLVHL